MSEKFSLDDLPEVDTDVLRHNQKYADNTPECAAGIADAAVPKLDRNGRPIPGEYMYDLNKPFQMTVRGLGQIRALEKKRATVQFQNEIADLKKSRASAQSEVERLRLELAEKTDAVRVLARDQDPTRLERRVREAVDAASEKDGQTIRALQADLGTARSEIAELKAAKRRLKAARQGR